MLNSDFFDEAIIPVSQEYKTMGKFFGQKKQQILVVLPAKYYEIDIYKKLLTKILASVKVDIEKDILVFALSSKTPFSLIHLAEKENCDKIIVFGVNLPQLGIHRLISKYQLTKMNHLSLILSDSFKDLEADVSKKLKFALWNALKELVLP